MATAAQLAANYANARHSTGPQSAAGKQAAAQNAFRHGFRSQSVLIPGDDPAEFQQLLDELTEHFGPADLTEDRHIREMADAEWRLRRARLHMEHILTVKVCELAAALPGQDATTIHVAAHEDLATRSAYFQQLARFEQKFERQYERAYRSWSRYQFDRSAFKRTRALEDLAEFERQLDAPPPGPSLLRRSHGHAAAHEYEIDTNEPNSQQE